MSWKRFQDLVVSVLWLSALLCLVQFYSAIEAWALDNLRYAFILFAPFGWTSFLGWVLAFAVSLWAAFTLGWNSLALRRIARWFVASVCFIVCLHATWVVYIVVRGGL